MSKTVRRIMPKPTKTIANNAARGLREWEKWKESGAQTPATQVGLIRANQLKNRENLSIKTINRMISFLERHAKNYKPSERDSKGRLTKGTVSYLLWGGSSALSWAKSQVNKS